MAIFSFILILLLNVYWALKYGRENYVSLYTGELGPFFTVVIWLYAAWGIANLIFVFL